VEVGTDRAADPNAFVTRLTVVPEPGENTAEWLGAGIEARSSGVVLEAGHGPTLSRHELAVEQDVADHPPFARHGVVGEEADTGERLTVPVDIAATEELVPAADR
jgi:hypothetical protein